MYKKKIIKVVIGEYHDYVAMNGKETVFDPTSEDCDRLLKESGGATTEDCMKFLANLNKGIFPPENKKPGKNKA
jgi:hypothetical protein